MGWLNWLWVCVSSERSWITAACCDTCWNTALTGTFSTPGREEVRCQLLPPHCLHGTTRVILCPGLCQADLCQVWCCFWWSDCSSDQPGKLRSLSSAEGKGDIDRWESKKYFWKAKNKGLMHAKSLQPRNALGLVVRHSNRAEQTPYQSSFCLCHGPAPCLPDTFSP